MNERKPLPALSHLNWLFELDAERGVLIRRVTRGPRAPAGTVVGTVDGKGYLHVNISGAFVRVHRIIFLMHYGWEPDGIDHKDTDKLNNRPCNLRPASDQQNAGNINPPAHNTSGIKGVSLNSKSGFWHAQIKINGKQTYLGRRATKEEAAVLYAEAARKHFGAYARVSHV